MGDRDIAGPVAEVPFPLPYRSARRGIRDMKVTQVIADRRLSMVPVNNDPRRFLKALN